MQAKNTLQRLQDWYLSQCDESWEHQNGCSITTLDNPGWYFKFNIVETYLKDVPFEKCKIQRPNEHDWCFCYIEDDFFIGAGGPQNLEEILITFLDWAEANKPKS